MSKNICTPENRKLIKALFEGKQIEYKSPYFHPDQWQTYSAEYEQYRFGPWNCNDEYKWRIKPETVTKELNFKKKEVVDKSIKVELEGVQEEWYKEGDILNYIYTDTAGLVQITENYQVGHDQSSAFKNYIFFKDNASAKKAYNQIQQQLKGN